MQGCVLYLAENISESDLFRYFLQNPNSRSVWTDVNVQYRRPAIAGDAQPFVRLH